MNVLFVGGTGNISRDCVKRAVDRGWRVTVLNRGSHPDLVPAGAHVLAADIRNTEQTRKVLGRGTWDVVADFIAFTPQHVKADLELFRGRTGQYLFISSASVYHKPPGNYLITESTPAHNPFWEYSQNKIACERLLWEAYVSEGFPVTIVRPSHTYGEGWLPTSFGSRDWTVAHRMLQGQEIVVHGDGESLWTLTHTRDFAVGFTGLVGHPAALGETFQITSDFVYSWNQIHRIIAAGLGVEAKLVHVPSDLIAQVLPDRGPGLLGDKAYSLVFDNTKMKRLVPEFNCTTSFHEGVRLSLAWFDGHPDLKVVDPVVNEEVERVLAVWRAMEEARDRL